MTYILLWKNMDSTLNYEKCPLIHAQPSWLENVPSYIAWAVTKDVCNLVVLLPERCLLRSLQHQIHHVKGWQDPRVLECQCVKPDQGW